MWYPVSLKIVNLFSYQESILHFEKRKGRMTCIYGSNQTDPKVLSNGSGKTSLLDCIAIALTGSPLRNISKKDIVRNGYTSGSIELILKNDVLKKEIQIKEFVEKTKSNRVEIYEDGRLNTSVKDLSPKEGHKYILGLLDISESDILNYYLLGRDTYQSFFTTKDSEKKDVINRFSKANIIDPIDPFIKGDVSITETKIHDIEKTIISIKAKSEVLQEQIKEINSIDLQIEKQKAVDNLNTRILELSDKIDRLKTEIEQSNGKKAIKQEELLKLELDTTIEPRLKEIAVSIKFINESVQKLRDQYINIDKKYEVEIKQVDDDIQKEDTDLDLCKKEQGLTKDLISEIERHLADAIECPKCKHQFCFKDKNYNVEEAKNILLPQLQQQIVDKKEYIDSRTSFKERYKKHKEVLLQSKKEEQASLLSEVEATKKQLTLLMNDEKVWKDKERQHINDINEIKSILSLFESTIRTKLNEIDLHNKKIEELFSEIDIENNRTVEDKSIPLQNQIDSLNEDLIIAHGSLTSTQEEKELLITWQKRFKKFKSYLANNSIGMIENLSNHFLQQMGTHLSVSVDGFREKADGDLKEEITIQVSRDGGVTLEDFNKFSAGEKAKCDVAGILSMQQLINLNSKSGGLDLLWIDEIVDSIDRISLSELILSLDSLNKTILLISHIDLPDTESAIKVEKKLGISSIIE